MDDVRARQAFIETLRRTEEMVFSKDEIHKMFPDFDPEKTRLCVTLTRILLPAQLCFFASGVFGAVLFVRKQFSVQGIAPLIYNMGTIVGGLLLVKHIGISSLAVGTVAGAFLGNFLLNAYFVHRAGLRLRLILDWHDEGLREWVRLSLPLMAGSPWSPLIPGSSLTSHRPLMAPLR